PSADPTICKAINDICSAAAATAITPAPQALYTYILLASGGNAGSTTVMQQSSLTNSNGGCNGNPNANAVSTDNNMLGSNTALHQQQYNTTYPYHAAAAAAQHLAASSATPPLMAHNPTLARPPHGTFRLPGFQIPNGELGYQTYHPAGDITFLSGAAPPGIPPAALRTTNSGAAVVSSQPINQPPVPQQILPSLPQQHKKDIRNLHDVTSRLVDSLSNVAGSCLEQTTWLRKNLAVKEDISADSTTAGTNSGGAILQQYSLKLTRFTYQNNFT
uniref:Uncharacterized protein n=1 Tax=Glossina palpalis gambiensis TaxID=67801 RepID=A0A1B0C110_9MUSC